MATNLMNDLQTQALRQRGRENVMLPAFLAIASRGASLSQVFMPVRLAFFSQFKVFV